VQLLGKNFSITPSGIAYRAGALSAYRLRLSVIHVRVPLSSLRFSVNLCVSAVNFVHVGDSN